jgi:hypothetical protein
MTTPKTFIVDAQTGVEELRDYNLEELAQHKIDLADAVAQKTAEAEEAKAKELAAEKLLALGIDPKVLGLHVAEQ